MDLTESKSSSLRWAIEELSKQKDELKSKLNIAHKREETNSLINEVHAQKAALENRILSLEEGLKASSELVDDPVMKITGDRSPQASSIAGTALAKPSGPTRQTVGLREILV